MNVKTLKRIIKEEITAALKEQTYGAKGASRYVLGKTVSDITIQWNHMIIEFEDGSELIATAKSDNLEIDYSENPDPRSVGTISQ